MLYIKLTNFWENWNTFIAEVSSYNRGNLPMLKSLTKAEYWIDQETAIKKILYYFKSDKDFRDCFTGYTHEEKLGIVEFLEDHDNKRLLILKILKSLEKQKQNASGQLFGIVIEEDIVFPTELVKFVESNSWFTLDSDEDDFENDGKLLFATRDNGNVGNETVGIKDYDEAKRVVLLLNEKFEGIELDIELVDEWVHINVKP